MFCPGCGIKEDRPLQFCRTCGADLRATRASLEQSNTAIVSSAVAREEIARAVAARIKDGEWWQVGAMIPEFEKLFETPQERRVRLIQAGEEQRLRRIRAGTITAAVGLGLSLLFLMLSTAKPDLILMAGPSLVVFLIGLAVVINGAFFTLHKQMANVQPLDTNNTGMLNQASINITAAQNELSAPRPLFPPSSVTENTTTHLSHELAKPAPGNKA